MAAIGIFIAVAAVSTAAIFIRKAQEHLPSLVIATYRLIMATIFLFPFSIKKLREDKTAINLKTFPLLAGAGVLLAFHFMSWITSLEYANVASSVVLVTTTPVWVTLLSPLFLKERTPRTFTIGLSIALVGIVVVSLSSMCGFTADGFQCSNLAELTGHNGLLGNLLALAGAWCMAIYMMVGRSARKQLSTQSYIFLVYAAAAFTLLVLSLITKAPLGKVNGQDFIWLVLMAIIPQIVGHSLLNWALGKLPAAYVSLALLGEPVGSSILAMIFLNEMPTWLEVLGSAIIIAGIYWASKPRKVISEEDLSETSL